MARYAPSIQDWASFGPARRSKPLLPRRRHTKRRQMAGAGPAVPESLAEVAAAKDRFANEKRTLR